MNDNIIQDIFEIKDKTYIEFKTQHNLTFVFKTKILIMKDKIPTAEIKPLGIIYKQNQDYYFAPLTPVESIEEIVKEYVKTLKEEE
ncbi:MAG: hypothetical protein E7Z80_08095 [Methanobrevibacter thaueri]|nr:hypothetical protein [Methanobrevibacter thaueri]